MQNYSRVLKFIHLEYGIQPIFCGADTITDKYSVCIQINKEISAEEVLPKQNVLFFLMKEPDKFGRVCHLPFLNI